MSSRPDVGSDVLRVPGVLPGEPGQRRGECGRVRGGGDRGAGRGSGLLGSGLCSLCSLKLLLLGLRRAEVGVLDHGGDVHAVVLAVGEAPPDEVLGLLTDCGLARELHLGGLEDDVLL